LINTEIAIIGGGPAGMCAALAAAEQGAHVILMDRESKPGGQLVKQTHRFFGSEKEHAGTRGINIASMLADELVQHKNVTIKTGTTVLAIYSDDVMAIEEKNQYKKINSKKTIIATGASEKMIPFPNNDLPGIYGAGAVQTLMNQYGVVPGNKVLMVGAGNIGLIVSYQLKQAGIDVAAIIDAAPHVGGYFVHASKIRRMGVPILTSHTIKEALGTDFVEGAIICQLDNNWQQVPGTEKELAVDTICLAVGLSPLTDLLRHCSCLMKYIPQLGGYVPIRDEHMETTSHGIYVAGDASGVEEASSAMVEGKIAGLSAAESLGYNQNIQALRQECLDDLKSLRAGVTGLKIRKGLELLAV
jgi:sarcosine oxidase subunit alpha